MIANYLLFRVDDDFVGVIDPIIAVLKSLIYINFKTIESFLDEEAFETDEDLSNIEIMQGFSE